MNHSKRHYDACYGCLAAKLALLVSLSKAFRSSMLGGEYPKPSREAEASTFRASSPQAVSGQGNAANGDELAPQMLKAEAGPSCRLLLWLKLASASSWSPAAEAAAEREISGSGLRL